MSPYPAGGNSRLHGRLSVYYSAAPPTAGEGDSGDIDDDETENSAEGDDETIMGGDDAMFGLDLDGDLKDEEPEQEGIPFGHHQRRHSLFESTTEARRIKLGPPQDADVRGRKIPPQVQLQKVEKTLHKLSGKVSVELVHAPSVIDIGSGGSNDIDGSGMGGESDDAMQDQISALKKRKAVYDEFDKQLGLQSRSPNPVFRLMSSFLGPLMRMIRVFVFIFRISFHVSTWRDPFVSFWVLVALALLCLVLIVFPWRSFFLLLVLVLLGPQVC